MRISTVTECAYTIRLAQNSEDKAILIKLYSTNLIAFKMKYQTMLYGRNANIK